MPSQALPLSVVPGPQRAELPWVDDGPVHVQGGGSDVARLRSAGQVQVPVDEDDPADGEAPRRGCPTRAGR